MPIGCDEVKSDILQALSNYTNSKIPFIFKHLLESGVISYLITIDTKSSRQTISCGLRIMGNLMTSEDSTTEELIKFGVIKVIDRFLFYPQGHIRKEAAWCRSNIAAGTKNQISALIDFGIIKKLEELVKDSVLDVAREAIWTISNCLSGSDLDLAFKLATNGAIQPILYVLKNHKEPSILGISMEGLNCLFNQGDIVRQLNNGYNPFVNFFEKEGGVDELLRLQNHENYEVYKLSVDLLERYFKTEPDN